jgi:hypothetical protein
MIDKQLIENFKSKFIVGDENECWNWVAALDGKGYGQLRYHYKQYISSRLSWEVFKGPIPEGKLVLHKCDNRKCVNPNHLYVGTYSDNMGDRESRNRAPDAGRPIRHSHEYVENIRQLHKEGNSQMAISRLLHISQSFISQVVRNVKRVDH